MGHDVKQLTDGPTRTRRKVDQVLEHTARSAARRKTVNQAYEDSLPWRRRRHAGIIAS